MPPARQQRLDVFPPRRITQGDRPLALGGLDGQDDRLGHDGEHTAPGGGR